MHGTLYTGLTDGTDDRDAQLHTVVWLLLVVSCSSDSRPVHSHGDTPDDIGAVDDKPAGLAVVEHDVESNYCQSIPMKDILADIRRCY